MKNHIFKKSCRRRFLTTVGSAGVSGLFSSAGAAAQCKYPLRFGLVDRVVILPKGFYSTYPHSNGFLSNTSVVIARQGDKNVCYRRYDLDSCLSDDLGEVENARTYYAVSRKGLIAVPTSNGIGILSSATKVFTELASWDGWRVARDCAIDDDGSRVLISRYNLLDRTSFNIEMIDVETRKVTTIFEANRPLDHAQFSPYDPSWIFFSDGSRRPQHRAWGWHPNLAPHSLPLFRQTTSSGRYADVGHETALFTKVGLAFVVYADSQISPKGLYQFDFKHGVSFISEGNADSHCNVSRDGKWAVVSTLSPAKETARYLDVCALAPRDWTESKRNYVESDIMAVSIRTGERRFLYKGSNAVSKGKSIQPFEAQPAISPDGRWVIVKDARMGRCLAFSINQLALKSFC